MFQFNDEKFKQQLLKDYYKLRIMFDKENNDTKKLDIIQDIITITSMLDDYFFVNQKSYNHIEFSIENSKLFSKVSSEYNKLYKNAVNQFMNEYSIHKDIITKSKAAFNNIKRNKVIDHLEPTDITKKTFYDCLLNVPNNNFRDYILNQLQNKNIIIFDFEYGKGSNFEQDGICYDISLLNKNYHIIESNKTLSYFTLFTIIHEITHSYVRKAYGIDTFFNLYKETMPFFQELKFMDYLKSNNIGENDRLINLNNYIFF